jgi:hypothetical protein
MMPPRPLSLGIAENVTAYSEALRPTYYGRVATFLSILGLAFYIIAASRVTEVFSGLEIVRQICLTGMISIAVLSVVLAVVLREVLAPVVIAFFIASIPFSAWVFSAATGTEYVPLSGGNFYSGALVGIFYLTWRHGDPQRFLRAIYLITTVYAVVYVLLWVGLTAGVITLPEEAKILTAADAGSGRGARLVLANAFATYGLAVAVVAMNRRPNVRDGLCVILFATCFYLAQSRVIAALVLAVMTAYTIIRLPRPRLPSPKIFQGAAFAVFVAGLTASIYVAVTPGVNPFSGDRYNLSAWARSEEIIIAQRLIPEHAWLGIGIPNGIRAYAPISDVSFFYPSDIGLVGVLVSYGIPGLMLYFAIICGACFATAKLTDIVEPRFAYAFGLTGAILTLYSVLAAVFTATAWGSLFLSLLVARVRRPVSYEAPIAPIAPRANRMTAAADSPSELR